jgi:hypothetical protein
MKAIIEGTAVADAPESDLVTIEGNYYFPPSSLSAGAFSDSPIRQAQAQVPLTVRMPGLPGGARTARRRPA